jgi:hypothetical protein
MDPRGRNAADLLTKVDGDGGLLGAEALQADYPGTLDSISAYIASISTSMERKSQMQPHFETECLRLEVR